MRETRATARQLKAYNATRSVNQLFFQCKKILIVENQGAETQLENSGYLEVEFV
jgi:hypothetical protein